MIFNARMCFCTYYTTTWCRFVYLARILCCCNSICGRHFPSFRPCMFGFLCCYMEGIEGGYITKYDLTLFVVTFTMYNFSLCFNGVENIRSNALDNLISFGSCV